MESRTYEFARLMLAQYYWTVSLSFPVEIEHKKSRPEDDLDHLPGNLVEDEFMIASMKTRHQYVHAGPPDTANRSSM
jgi:hypothetical protein